MNYDFWAWLRDLRDVPPGGWLFWAFMVFLLLIGNG